MRIPILGLHITAERPHQGILYHSEWYARHMRDKIVSRGGVLVSAPHTIWEMPESKRRGNILHDTGEIAILSAYFATGYANYGAPVAALFLGLDHRSALGEADTLATMAAHELTLAAEGYARKTLSTVDTGFTISDSGAGYYKVTTETVEWTATGDWDAAVDNLFLCSDATALSDASDKHILCSKALSASRTLLNGDKLQASMYIGLSE
jgi:hypothetical protein